MTGCIFTDPINAPPTVEEIVPPPSISRGDTAEFTARTKDDQQEPPVLTWAHQKGACPGDQNAAPAQRSRIDRYKVLPSDTGGRFCVWAFATDSHGAVGAKTYEANPANHVPVAQIDVVSPEPVPMFRLFSDFHLSGARSSDRDQDPLVYQWKPIKAPAGTNLVLAPCAGAMAADPQEQCFSADVFGEYKIGLTVSDGIDSAETVQTLMVLDDQAPCLSQTAPTMSATKVVHPPTMPDHFEVSRVDDDGEPLPAGPRGGRTHFSWAWARGDGAMNYLLDRDIPWYDIPEGTFPVGETVRVRVEISDRNAAAIRKILDSCADQDVCAARPGCFQRFTWKIEYR